MICVSIVSHAHGSMVPNLVEQLLACPEISQIIVTLNISENFPKITDKRFSLILNMAPKGFGENHNFAFNACTRPYFCVVNPDIILEKNLFPDLLEIFNEKKVGVVAPLVANTNHHLEDNL